MDLVCYKKHPNFDRIGSSPWKLVGFGLVVCLIKECFLMYSEIQVNNTCVGYMDVFNTPACDMVTSYHFLWLVIPFMLYVCLFCFSSGGGV